MTTQRKPEWSFQANLHHFLERVVLPPCEVRGFDKASAAFASIATRMMAQGRGVKDGTPDHFVVQGDPLRLVWFECKAATGASTPAQIGTANAYERCGITCARDCRTIGHALDALIRAGVRLHPNAPNIAVEYQARVDASLRELKAAAPRKRSSAARAPKPALSAVKRGNAFTRARLGL